MLFFFWGRGGGLLHSSLCIVINVMCSFTLLPDCCIVWYGQFDSGDLSQKNYLYEILSLVINQNVIT